MENSQLKKRDLFREISLKAFTDEMKERPFTSREMIGCFLTYFFGFFKDEQVFAVFFDSGCRYSGLLHIQNGVLLVSSPIAESIEKKGKELGAASFVLAHNHPGVPAAPSAEDVLTTGAIRRYFEGSPIVFLDHFIISGNDFSTMFTESLWKKRYDGGRTTLF
ncbi:MAG: JAB domain-containing protein [Clostridia bacterium]|nr:JAB domain-containing protein [Clostridia bacterium]MBQ6676595.1 JAB domain-containing protein [Clostridia bacterium]